VALLDDLLADLLASGGGPSSDRGLAVMLAVAAFACGVATVVATMRAPGILHGPSWGIAVLVGSILFGAGGALLATLHIARNEDDRVLGVACLAASLAGPLLPLVWVVAR
jgi:hypothetical protein